MAAPVGEARSLTDTVDGYTLLQHRAPQLARGAGGRVALVVPHDLNHAAGVAHRRTVLYPGRRYAAGAPGMAHRPDLLSAVYGVTVTILPHPHRHAPLVLTLPAQLLNPLQEPGYVRTDT